MKEGITRFRFFRQAKRKGLVWEVVSVGAVGLIFGFFANAISPKGLGLARNYFPAPSGGVLFQASTMATGQVSVVNLETNIAVQTNAIPESPAMAGLSQKGLQMVEGEEVWRFFNDPRYQRRQIVFIDARDDRHYNEGHIPGASQFDHYRPEKYLLPILAICQQAELIVVYCNGGDCEDSEYAAIMLREAGVPSPKLFVYSSGMTEWITKKHPLKSGDQP